MAEIIDFMTAVARRDSRHRKVPTPAELRAMDHEALRLRVDLPRFTIRYLGTEDDPGGSAA